MRHATPCRTSLLAVSARGAVLLLVLTFAAFATPAHAARWECPAGFPHWATELCQGVAVWFGGSAAIETLGAASTTPQAAQKVDEPNPSTPEKTEWYLPLDTPILDPNGGKK